MQSIEGIRSQVIGEYVNPDALRKYAKDLRAAREAAIKLQRANRRLGAAQGVVVARAKAEGKVAAAAERVAAATEKTEKAAKGKAAVQAATGKLTDKELRDEDRKLKIKEAQLAQEDAAEKLAREKDKESLKARKEQTKAERALLKEEKARSDQNKDKAGDRAAAELLETEKRLTAAGRERLETIRRSGDLQGDALRVKKDELAIAKAINDAERARLKAQGVDGSPLTQEQQVLASKRAEQRIEDVIAKNKADSAAASAKAEAERKKAVEAAEAAQRRINALKAAEKRIEDSRAPGGITGPDSPLNAKERVDVERQLLDIEKDRLRAQETADPLERARLEASAKQRLERINRTVTTANDRLSKSLQTQNALFQNLAGTVRGVVVGLVVYRGITRSLEAIGQVLFGGVAFGAELDTIRASIGGLITATATLTEGSTELVTTQERYAAATALAGRELREVRKQAIGTSATFAQLARNYQTNVAQGLNAGLELSEFRDVALKFSQAATLLGVPQEQLAEEIRSVLQGTIRSRDTRIAVALGITNEEIKAAREADQVYELLQRKFEGITEAAEALRGTLPVIFSDLQDALQFAAQDGAEPLRKKLEEIGKQLRSGIADDQGNVDQEVTQRFQTFFRPFEGIAEDAGATLPLIADFANTFIGLFSSVLNLASATARVLAPLTRLVVEFAAGFVTGINTAASVVRGLVRAFEFLLKTANESLFGGFFGELLPSIARVAGLATSVFALVKVFGLLKAAVAGLGAAVSAATTVMGFMGVSATALASSFGIVLVTVIALLAAFNALVASSDRVRNGLDSLFDTGTVGARNKVRELTEEIEALEAMIFNMENYPDFAESVGGLPGVKSVDDYRKRLGLAREELENLNKVLEEGKVSSPFEDGFLDDLASGLVDTLSGVLGEAFGEIEAFRNAAPFFASDDVAESFRLSAALQESRLEYEKIGQAQGRIARVASAVLDLEEQRTKQLRELNKQISLIDEQLKDTELDEKRRAALGLQRLALQRDLNLSNSRYGEELARQVALIAAGNDELSRRALIESSGADIILGSDPLSGFGPAVEEAVRLRNSLLELSGELLDNRGEADATKRAFDFSERFLRTLGVSGTELQTIKALEQERLTVLDDQGVAIQKNISLIQREAEAQKRLTKVSGGIQAGLGQAANSLQTGRLFEEATLQSVSDFRQGTRAAVAAAFTPGQNVNLAEGAKTLGLSIATNFVTAAVDQFLTQNIVKFLGRLLDLDSGADLAAQQKILSEIVGDTSAQMTSLSLAAELAAGRLSELAGSGLAGSAVSGASAAEGRATGGFVGFDEGGIVRGPQLPRPVPGFDSRDRVPALLRRGEFVATPEMNRAAPGLFSFLSRLRRGVLSGMPNFASLSGGFLGRAGVQGFAQGGFASVAPRQAAAQSSGSSEVRVLPVMVLDPTELRKIHNRKEWLSGLTSRTNETFVRRTTLR